MKIFTCDHCNHPVFFENTQCLNCTHSLGYLPGEERMMAITEAGDGFWTNSASHTQGKLYRMCENYSERNACNWMLAKENPESLCLACRLNRTIPDLSDSQNIARWSRLEAAKRRLVYSLLQLGLPLQNKQDNPSSGLAFDFLAADDKGLVETEQVVTGHNQGVITINIAEADPLVRLKTRLNMNERYRTILGHFRHEIGHYYWQLLIRDGNQLDAFRNLFGDERLNYDEALQQYYAHGVPENWQDSHISSYAASHPWEDWAETWAHYLHMIDTLETVRIFGLSHVDFPTEALASSEDRHGENDPVTESFIKTVNEWLPTTLALNSINRSMGLDDIYPFVLSQPVVNKLLFIHQVINQNRS